MNCQEYREMIEDALDTSLHGELELRVRRHLEHCAECRSYLEQRRTEHVALFTSVNAAYSNLRPPSPDFMERLAREVDARRSVRRGWRRLSLPRWALIAASLALMAGFVFAAAVMVDAVIAKDGDIEGTHDDVADVPADVPYASDASFVSSTDNQQPTVNNQLSTLKGGTTMKKGKAAVAAFTAAIATAPLGAANGDEYQFIDPTTYPAANYSHSAGSAAITLTAGAVPVSDVAGDLEARSRSSASSAAIALEADKFQGTVISIM